MLTWIGTKRLAVVPAITIGAGTPPQDFRQQVVDRIFFDPAPTSGVDRSLRRYIHTVSYGRATLEAEVFPAVTVNWAMHGTPPIVNPGQTMDDAISSAGGNLGGFQYIMVVFPPGIPGVRSWAFWGGTQAKSYVFLDNNIGAWAMELLHMVTEFGDLYGAPASRSPTPGFYDEMDAADATHPSSFTKLKMGWLDTSSIDIASGTSTAETFVLHPLALLQPPPPGRTTAVRIPISGSSSHYFLVESRERLDDYDRGTNTLNAGIPGEGVVIFDVDETTWPPLWLKTSPALAAGAQFTDHTAQIEIIVDNPIAGGGFPISVRSTEPARCETIRAELESLVFEINDLQRELKKASPVEKPSIAGRIKAAQKLVTALKQEALSLHCRLQ